MLGLTRAQLLGAAREALVKLAPQQLINNPVVFAVALCSLAASLLAIDAVWYQRAEASFSIFISILLWLSVYLATLAEALAEAQAAGAVAAISAPEHELLARRRRGDSTLEMVGYSQLRAGDLVLVQAGDAIPGDGEVIEGIATVNEAAVTGESAPVIREAGAARGSVIGGTTVLSDQILVRLYRAPGQSQRDQLAAMMRATERQRSPSELALLTLLCGLMLVFVVVTVTMQGFAIYSGGAMPVVWLIALLVGLAPTSIGGLLGPIALGGGIRMLRLNVLSTSPGAVETAGDVDVLLLDKTGTITRGNRQCAALVPIAGHEQRALAQAALLASLGDETPEGKSIRAFVAQQYDGLAMPAAGTYQVQVFSAQSRCSGIDSPTLGQLRKGAPDRILATTTVAPPPTLPHEIEKIALSGGTPLLVARDGQILGLIHLKDQIRDGVRLTMTGLRTMGIRTIMLTGDNRITAASLAAEAGVDDFVAEATPETKLRLIRDLQEQGRVVAMVGDGANDAPALAQADLGVAFAGGDPEAREAANLVDRDNDPNKLLTIIRTGRQSLTSRGTLTTFSIAGDTAKTLALLPALFIDHRPALAQFNFLHLQGPETAILAATLFNLLTFLMMLPLALRGVRHAPQRPAPLLQRHLLIYGLGGIALPLLVLPLLDAALVLLGWGRP